MRFSAALVIFASASAVVLWPLPKGHNPMHINCPPGSHTTPASKNDIARKLEGARALSISARSLTSYSQTVSQPNAPK